MNPHLPDWLRPSPSIERALSDGRPVVALESTVITHGLPWPENLKIALEMETAIREEGCQPATIGAVDGVFYVGLDEGQLERVARSQSAMKISRRDIPWAVVKGAVGGTTVAATMLLARMTGIRVFATGGIGGVHPGTFGDVSADLPELARSRVIVVCAGAKSILDLPRTIEWLETAGVPVVGYCTDTFPAFYSRSSGIPVVARADSPEQVAQLSRVHWEVPGSGGLLVAAPCPEQDALLPGVLDELLAQARLAARRQEISGKDLTPFLLRELADTSRGATVQSNRSLLVNNAHTAAAIAVALTK